MNRLGQKKQKPEQKVETKVVTLPVFPAADPIGRLQAAALAGEISIVLPAAKSAQNAAPAPSAAPDQPLEEIIEVLKIKMFDHQVSDQTVYELLFDKRLENQSQPDAEMLKLSLGEILEVLKIKMFNEKLPDQMVYDLLFENRLEQEWARHQKRSKLRPLRGK